MIARPDPVASAGLAAYGRDIAVGEQLSANKAAMQIRDDLQAQQAYLNRIDGQLRAGIADQFASGPLPASWNMRDASTASMAAQAAGPRTGVRNSGAANTNNDSIDWNAVENAGSWGQHVANASEQGLLYAAKYKGQSILSSAWALQTERMVAVAAADNLESAAHVFKSPGGKTAIALAEASSKYSFALKGAGVLAVGSTVLEEGAYIKTTYDNHPGKVGYAVGASVTNVAADGSAVYIGMTAGAKVGALFAPWTFGLSIPVGGAIGGIGGHLLYDTFAKEQVRSGWTGIKKDGQ